MIRYGRVIEDTIRESFRWVKFFGLSKEDKLDKKQITPFGIDSVPLEGMIAIYAESGIGGKGAVIGYLSPSAIAEKGEIRLYSLDSNLEEKSYIWVKNNGDVEINGDADNLVRYSKLEEGFNNLKADVNNMIQQWNTFCSVYVAGSPTTAGSPITLASNTVLESTANIVDSKIDNVKTN